MIEHTAEQAKWSPGPWAVNQSDWADGYGFWWEISCPQRNDETVAELADTVIPPVAYQRNGAGEIPPAEHLANANLIAAAPDLYEALLAVTKEIGADLYLPHNRPLYDRVDAALSKARGEV